MGYGVCGLGVFNRKGRKESLITNETKVYVNVNPDSGILTALNVYR